MAKIFFDVLKIFFLGYSYIIITSYFMSMFRFFTLLNKINPTIFSSIQFYMILSFLLTSLFIILIRFSLFNVLAFVFSIILEFIVNKTLLYYFYPLTYFFSFGDKHLNAFPLGFLFYLSYFLAPKKEIKEFFLFFSINFLIFILWQFLFLKVTYLPFQVLVDFLIALYLMFYDEIIYLIKKYIKNFESLRKNK